MTAKGSGSVSSSISGADVPDDGHGRAALFAEYHRTGDHRIRDRLIESNLGLAESIARRYSGKRESPTTTSGRSPCSGC